MREDKEPFRLAMEMADALEPVIKRFDERSEEIAAAKIADGIRAKVESLNASLRQAAEAGLGVRVTMAPIPSGVLLTIDVAYASGQ